MFDSQFKTAQRFFVVPAAVRICSTCMFLADLHGACLHTPWVMAAGHRQLCFNVIHMKYEEQVMSMCSDDFRLHGGSVTARVDIDELLSAVKN